MTENENYECGECGFVGWGTVFSGHMQKHRSPSTPRVAASLSDLRVGQVVAYCDPTSPETDQIVRIKPKHLGPNKTNWWAFANFRAGYVVILSDPPPEPVSVSREAFDRLVEMVDWNPCYHEQLEDAARDLVNEVRGVDADWRHERQADDA